MFKNIIKNYINNLTKEKINTFALDNGIKLKNNEIDIIYKYIKSDWETIIYSNHYIILNKIKDNIDSKVYQKIDELIIFYKEKYKKYLI